MAVSRTELRQRGTLEIKGGGGINSKIINLKKLILEKFKTKEAYFLEYRELFAI